MKKPSWDDVSQKAGYLILPLIFICAAVLLWFSVRVPEPEPSLSAPVFANVSISSPDSAQGDAVAKGPVPTLSEEDIRAMLKERQDASRFTVQVDASGTIREGSRELSLTVANPAVNTADCTFELLQGEDVLYSSPTLEPDTYMETLTLGRALEKGENRLTVRYHILLDGLEIGRVEVESSIACK